VQQLTEKSTGDEHTEFDWRIYADGTAAGLTVLIPIPIVDLAFESTFRRRMPMAIARTRGRTIRTVDRIRLGRGHGRLLSLQGCLAIPLAAGRYLLRRMWRKLIIVFAIADAASQVSEYWHRAYLMDHMVRSGHLDPEADTAWAAAVFQRVLREADTSPLVGVARQVVMASHRGFMLLIRARRRGAAETTESLGDILKSNWEAAEHSLRSVALRYNEIYSQRLTSTADRS
jgi:hypothetical protein